MIWDIFKWSGIFQNNLGYSRIIWDIQGVKRYCFFCRVMSGTHFRYWYENSTMLMLKSTVLWSLWREIKAPEHTRSLIWSGGYPIHVSVHKILRQYILAVGLVEMVVADLVHMHTWRHLQPHSPVIQLHLHS